MAAHPELCARCVGNIDGARRGSAGSPDEPSPVSERRRPRCGEQLRWLAADRCGDRRGSAGASAGSKAPCSLSEAARCLPCWISTWCARTTRGAAFSFLDATPSGWQRWFFSRRWRSVVSVALIVWLAAPVERRAGLLAAALALILGGALGNVIDRLRLATSSTSCMAHWHAALLSRPSTSPIRRSRSAPAAAARCLPASRARGAEAAVMRILLANPARLLRRRRPGDRHRRARDRAVRRADLRASRGGAQPPRGRAAARARRRVRRGARTRYRTAPP